MAVVTAWPTTSGNPNWSAASFNQFIAAVQERQDTVNRTHLATLNEGDLVRCGNVAAVQTELEVLAPFFFNTATYPNPASSLEGLAGDPADLFYTPTSMLAAAGLTSGWRRKTATLGGAWSYGRCTADDLRGSWLLEDIKAVCQVLKCTQACPTWGWNEANSNDRRGEYRSYVSQADATTRAQSAFDAATQGWIGAMPCAFTAKFYFTGGGPWQSLMVHRRAIPYFGVYDSAQNIPRATDCLAMPTGPAIAFNYPPFTWQWSPWGTMYTNNEVEDLNGEMAGYTLDRWHLCESLAAQTGTVSQFTNYVGGTITNHPAWCADSTGQTMGRGYAVLSRPVFTWSLAYS